MPLTRLHPLQPDAFQAWRAQSIPAYAADKVRAGQWRPDEALAEAEASFASLLPEGAATPGHHFFSIEDGAGAPVGVLWLAQAERGGQAIGYIYDLVVWPAHRRQGHAARAMQLLEAEAAQRGLQGLALHVFGHNPSAQQLYARLGYAPTNIQMFKPLPGDGRQDDRA